MTWFKWIVRVTVGLVLLLALTAAIATYYLKSAPDFYARYVWDDEARSIMNQRTVDKITATRTMAERAVAHEEQAQNPQPPNGRPPVPAAEPLTLTVTEEELHAFLMHNGEVFQDVRDYYGKYIQNPGIYLRENQLILAAELTDLGSIASFYFEPRLDDDGRLHLRLIRSRMGRLPLPRSLLEGQQERVRLALEERMPAWREAARMTNAGRANVEAAKAAMAQLLLDTMADEPADAILFLPDLGDNGPVPLRLTHLKVSDREMTLTLAPLNRQERRQLLARIREAQPDRSGS